jgi:hypothetical protein
LLVSCLQEESIQPIKAILVEGTTADYEVELVYSGGEGEFFITVYYKHILDQATESCNFFYATC